MANGKSGEDAFVHDCPCSCSSETAGAADVTAFVVAGTSDRGRSWAMLVSAGEAPAFAVSAGIDVGSVSLLPGFAGAAAGLTAGEDSSAGAVAAKKG